MRRSRTHTHTRGWCLGLCSFSLTLSSMFPVSLPRSCSVAAKPPAPRTPPPTSALASRSAHAHTQPSLLSKKKKRKEKRCLLFLVFSFSSCLVLPLSPSPLPPNCCVAGARHRCYPRAPCPVLSRVCVRLLLFFFAAFKCAPRRTHHGLSFTSLLHAMSLTFVRAHGRAMQGWLHAQALGPQSPQVSLPCLSLPHLLPSFTPSRGSPTAVGSDT